MDNLIFNNYNTNFPTQRRGIESYETNTKQSLKQFIEQSVNIEYIGNGASGIGIIVKIKEDEQSPFYFKHNKNPVSKLFIKMCIIDNVNVKTPREIQIKDDKASFLPTTNNDFSKEIDIQNMVFQESSSKLKPLCPAIIFSEITTLNNIKKKYKKMYDTLFYHNHTNYNMGIIVMELAEGFEKPHDNDLPNLIPICMFLMIRLIIETNYIHADYHFDNILIFKKNNYYFCSDAVDIYPIIIDFGRMIQLNSLQKTNMMSLYNNKQYFEMLLYVKEITVKDPQYNKYGKFGYRWLYCEDDLYKPLNINCSQYYNKRIDDLFIMYNKCNQSQITTEYDKIISEYDQFIGGKYKIKKYKSKKQKTTKRKFKGKIKKNTKKRISKRKK